MSNIFFNAHHSPIGSFSSFTLGYPGASGGLGIELGKPADQNIFIGVETRRGVFEQLPFYGDKAAREAERYTTGAEAVEDSAAIRFSSFAMDSIRRDFHLGTDTWHAGSLTFRIFSPVQPIPDPETADDEQLRSVLLPAVVCELTIDNSGNSSPRRAFFGFQGNDPYSAMRIVDGTDSGNWTAVGQGRHIAVVASNNDARSALGFGMKEILEAEPENQWFGLGVVGALLFNVPADSIKTFTFAVCFYRGGLVTSGMDTSYYYSRLFDNIESVATSALSRADEIKKLAVQSDSLLNGTTLSPDQRFMLAHAIRSYYGSTELLERAGKPLWVVNEGEYRMMNTFDLTVDHLFFELRMNPWVVRNVLDLFVERYSYADQVHFPGSKERFPGGISFTHDMGIGNVFSRPQFSSYEKTFLDGCFSYMTHEQLVNWLCAATTYAEFTGDTEWRFARLPVFEQCLQSLLNRDNPDPAQRNGLMGLDSDRTAGGAEITTYDSLDTSLGQARNNLYMSVKTWAAYVALERLFTVESRPELAAIAGGQAELSAGSIADAADAVGLIPAIIGEGNEARIISAIEGLVFPLFLGWTDTIDINGRFGRLIEALKKHFLEVLKPGICLFDDGGWKLSSTSDNSWLSKIYLAQFVAREAFRLNSAEITENADSAHVSWLLDPEYSYYSWSDQMIAGKAMASRYYPRGVTAILWLLEERAAS